MSLPVKLIAAFAAIVVGGLAAVYLLANQATATELRQFMFRGGMVGAVGLAAHIQTIHTHYLPSLTSILPIAS